MDRIIINVDGKNIELSENKTILKAALDAGIYIPNLCSHPDLQPVGACQLCVVEIEGMNGITTSCTTMAANGMVIHTKTPELEKIRRLSMEMMLAGHPSECTGCPKYGKCELASLIQYLGVNDAHLRKKPKSQTVNTSNPLFVHDMGKCILCGRCVRACRELRGVKVLNYLQKDGQTIISAAEGKSLMDSACKFCGACAEVCPTGTIRDKDGCINPNLPKDEALVPCRATCPAHTDAPRYLRYIREGKFGEAVAVIREKAPFPLTLGHICTHPCEAACRRKDVNEAVSIKELKRFAAERDNKMWKVRSRQNPPTGKKVAVIGAGPAGLTAAFYLAKQGHDVTVFEEMQEPGGMMRYGIPSYRLPSEVVASEIEEIKGFGVKIITGKKIEDTDALMKEGYHAVLIAVGTHQGVRLPIPGADFYGVLLNIDFLRSVRLGGKAEVGKRVVVLGGGNVAFDCARTALRLGAEDVHIACLEARDCMTASEDEIEEAEEEGVKIHNSKTFLEITGENGKVTGVKCQDVSSFCFDENKRLQLTVKEGSEHVIPADTVIFAIGQRPVIPGGFGIELAGGNRVAADQNTLATSKEGVFAAGDAVTGTLIVVEAIAAGRKAAESIDKYLGGNGDINEILVPKEPISPYIGREEGFGYRKRSALNLLPAEQRMRSFAQVDRGYNETAAHESAERCLQCDLRTCISNPKFWTDYSDK